MSANIRALKTCQHCGKNFIAQKTTTKYCTQPCASKAYKYRMRKSKVEAVVQKEQETALMIAPALQKEYLSIKEACQLIGAK